MGSSSLAGKGIPRREINTQYISLEHFGMLTESDKNKAIQISQDRELALAIKDTEDKVSRDLEGGKGSNTIHMDIEGSKKVQVTEYGKEEEVKAEQDIDLGQKMGDEDEEGKVQLEESEELFESQESKENFARSIGVILTEEEGGSQEEDKRVSKRLREKERDNKKSLDMAMDRKEAQNAFINKDFGRKAKKTALGGSAPKASHK